MRILPLFLSLLIHPFCAFSITPAENPGSWHPSQTDPSIQNQPVDPEEEEKHEVADRRSNEYEYNLYDRQQNRFDQQNRQQQQQYYYQQSSGNGSDDNGTQYNRTKTRSQYFNPRDE